MTEVIPEDEEIEEQLIIIHPLNEVKQDSVNYHQIIKNHIPVVRLMSPKSIKSSKVNLGSVSFIIFLTFR